MPAAARLARTPANETHQSRRGSPVSICSARNGPAGTWNGIPTTASAMPGVQPDASSFAPNRPATTRCPQVWTTRASAAATRPISTAVSERVRGDPRRGPGGRHDQDDERRDPGRPGRPPSIRRAAGGHRSRAIGDRRGQGPVLATVSAASWTSPPSPEISCAEGPDGRDGAERGRTDGGARARAHERLRAPSR